MRTLLLSLALLATSCSSVSIDDLEGSADSGNVTLYFSADNTRASCAECFNRLNIQLFDASGAKVLSQMRTQISTDASFGSLSLDLSPGEYTVVAVGHSSAKSATIKSPQDVRFTASDGEKLTDTFCRAQQFNVGDNPEHFDVVLQRATAMFRLVLTDTDIPSVFSRLKFAYSGGSANVNPTTLEGITHSSQTETRPRSDGGVYDVFTFPYMAASGTLKVTVSALDAAGNVLRQRVFDNINLARNRITTYTGQFFGDGGGTLTQPEMGFTVEDDWSGEDIFEF